MPNKEKIKQKYLSNSSIDPLGRYVDAEELIKKIYDSYEDYYYDCLPDAEFDPEDTLLEEDYREIYRTIINTIKQQANEWKIELEGSLTIIKHSSGKKHYKEGFEEEEWEEIELSINLQQQQIKISKENNKNMVNWQEIDPNFTEKLQQEWTEKKFNYNQAKKWIDIGLKPTDADFCAWLRDIKNQDIENFAESQWVKANLELLREENKRNLEKKTKLNNDLNKVIHIDLSKIRELTPQLTKKWQDKKFGEKESREWINSGLRVQDFEYAAWLRDIFKITAAEYQDLDECYDGLLREQHQEYLQTNLENNKNENLADDKDWKNIHPKFTLELQKEWEDKDFNYEETEQWINIAGLQPSEAKFSRWLKDRKITPEWVLNCSENPEIFEDLKKEHNIEILRNNYSESPSDEGFFNYLNELGKMGEGSGTKRDSNPMNVRKAQEWLDQTYPDEVRSNIMDLNISQKKIWGKLDLKGFVNLQRLVCDINGLTDLDLSDCTDLRYLWCSNNYLTNTNFLSTLKSPEKLVNFLAISNYFNEDLSCFSKFTNLTVLYIGRGQNSCFYGSLRHLKPLTKLYSLIITDTDIDSGLEYLPNSLENFWCGSVSRSNPKCLKLDEQLKRYKTGEDKYNIQSWKMDNYDLVMKTKKEHDHTRDESSGLHSQKEIKEIEKLKEQLIRERVSKEIEGIQEVNLVNAWFSKNCALVINKEKGLQKQDVYNLWIVSDELCFERKKGRINCLNFAREITPDQAKWKEIIEHFQEALNSEYPAVELYTNAYSRKLPSLTQNYQNVTRIEKKLTNQDINPDDFLQPYDIVCRKVASAPAYYAGIYLGDGRVAYISDLELDKGNEKKFFKAKIDNWENFLKGESEIEIHHPFIPFKKSELIQRHVDIAVNKAKYGKTSRKLFGNNYENFATMCVYGIDVPLQSKTINQITRDPYYLLKDIEESNELFDELEKTSEEVDAQEWLDKEYPKEKRTNIKKLDISNKGLKGSLDLRDFANLEELDCSNNQLANITKELKQLPKPEKLTRLNIWNNGISPQDLSFLSPFTGLERLELGNCDHGFYNPFHGSLEPLENLTKLSYLDISFTDISKGLEYLPESLENTNKLRCDYDLGDGNKTKVGRIYEELKPYSLLIDKWKKDNPRDIKPTLERLVGKGSYGEVYYGKWKSKDVAVKKLYLTLNNKDDINKIFNEINILKGLDNEHIVRYHGFFAHDQGSLNTALIIMDYAENGNLTDFINGRQNQPQDWNFNKKLISQMTRGLNYIHKQGVIHRDLKSLNILLTNNYQQVKISDFGLARTKNISATQTKNIVGTLGWMAPEVLSDNPKYSEQSDIYALGMVMWEIASKCTAPFKDIDNILVYVTLNNGREIIPDDTPKNICNIIERCWNANPNERITLTNLLAKIDSQLSDLQNLPQSQDSEENNFNILNSKDIKGYNVTPGIRNILIVGRTGSGKSTLANVLSKTDSFKESSGINSETKSIQTELFEEKGIKYQVIDTVGIGDDKLSKQEVLLKITGISHFCGDGLSQIFFVSRGRLDQEREAYDLLKSLFSEDISKYVTIVRTNSPNKKTHEKDRLAIRELISEIESEKIIFVDNPPLIIDSSDDEDSKENKAKTYKQTREKSRKKLLDHLEKEVNKICQTKIELGDLQGQQAQIETLPKGNN